MPGVVSGTLDMRPEAMTGGSLSGVTMTVMLASGALRHALRVPQRSLPDRIVTLSKPV